MALSRDQMARLDALLEQALALDRLGREAWLQALGPEDRDLEPALRRSLLADGDEPMTLPRLTQAPNQKPGDLVGPYRLMKPLGAGGMAQVWLAQRADGAFQREVALKLPTLGRGRADLAERFARETAILAQLEHPRIARLYDAGVSQEGLPYLAMQYVQGQPIGPGSNALDLKAALRLFLQVLEAVQYAHGKAVVHRDIKPSNILLGSDGQVHLLDFGVAKLLEQPHTRELTEVYGRALTPQYASPELLKGEAVDAAADIYALGVLLYELLTGERPYELKSSSVQELQRAIATVRIAPPSTKRAQLKGDLDAIVLKALATDPTQRYESAQAFAQDLQRYLDYRPVSARKSPPVHRLRLFARRNTALLGTTAGFILIAAVALAGWLHRAPPTPPPSTPPAASSTVPEKSIAVLPFVDMSEKHDQEYFSDGLSEELIVRLSQFRDLKVIARTSAFAFKGKNEDMRTIASKLGVARLLEGSVRKSGKALRITAQMIRASDGAHLWSRTYEREFRDIFKVQEEIARTVAEAMQAELSVASGSESKHPRNLEAYNLFLRGNYLYGRADFAGARKLFQQAVVMDPGYALAWVRIAATYWKQAYSDMPPAQARAGVRDALQHALRIAPDFAAAHRGMAHVYETFDWDWEAARAEFERAIALEPGGENERIAREGIVWLQSMRDGNVAPRIAMLQEDVLQDPLDTEGLYELVRNQFLASRFLEAAATSRRLSELEPSYAGAHFVCAEALLFAGKAEEALVVANQVPDPDDRQFVLSEIYWRLGRVSESNAAFEAFRKKNSQIAVYNVAQLYALRNEAGPAFDWLERAFTQHDPAMLDVKFDPRLESLRQDPRYKSLLVRMRLDRDSL